LTTLRIDKKELGALGVELLLQRPAGSAGGEDRTGGIDRARQHHIRRLATQKLSTDLTMASQIFNRVPLC
jgi:DNA-binding LacI/PurR family transcriptional regulator